MAEILKNGPICIFPSFACNPNVTYSSPSTDSTRFPITNIIDRTHPLRVFRTASGGTRNVTVEIPSGTYVTGAVVNNTNWSGTVSLYSLNSSGSSPTLLDLDGGIVNTVQDPRTGRYHAMLRTDLDSGVLFDGTTAKYLRINFSSGQLAFGSDLQVGAVTPFAYADMKLFPGGFKRSVDYEIMNPIISSDMEYGGVELIEIGDLFVKIDVANLDVINTSVDLAGSESYILDQGANLFSMIRNRTSSFVFYENDLDSNIPYTVKLVEKSFKIKYDARFKAISTAFSMVEMI